MSILRFLRPGNLFRNLNTPASRENVAAAASHATQAVEKVSKRALGHIHLTGSSARTLRLDKYERYTQAAQELTDSGKLLGLEGVEIKLKAGVKREYAQIAIQLQNQFEKVQFRRRKKDEGIKDYLGQAIEAAKEELAKANRRKAYLDARPGAQGLAGTDGSLLHKSVKNSRNETIGTYHELMGRTKERVTLPEGAKYQLKRSSTGQKSIQFDLPALQPGRTHYRLTVTKNACEEREVFVNRAFKQAQALSKNDARQFSDAATATREAEATAARAAAPVAEPAAASTNVATPAVVEAAPPAAPVAEPAAPAAVEAVAAPHGLAGLMPGRPVPPPPVASTGVASAPAAVAAEAASPAAVEAPAAPGIVSDVARGAFPLTAAGGLGAFGLSGR